MAVRRAGGRARSREFFSTRRRGLLALLGAGQLPSFVVSRSNGAQCEQMECGQFMTTPRVLWVVLAVVTALWGVFVANEPLYQISSCEVVNMDNTCGRTIFAHYGAGVAALLVVPVALCAVPAALGWRGYSWLVAGTILLISIVALPATDSVFGALVYYVPVGVLAIVMAVFQRWYERRPARRSTT